MTQNYSIAYLIPTDVDVHPGVFTLARIMITSVVTIALTFDLIAQNSPFPPEDIGVVARPSQDSITLRWAPLTYELWRTANNHGYRVERYLVTREGTIAAERQRTVLASSIMPWTEDKWQPIVPHNEYAAVAAQALFGDRFEVDLTRQDIFTIVNKSRENEQRFAFALFTADMSPLVAKASGLWFTDTTARPEEQYLYRILINGTSSYGSVFTGTDDNVELPQPQGLEGDFAKETVQLKWHRHLTSPYSAFIVERRENDHAFIRLYNVPITTVSRDTQDHDRYEYAADSLPDPSAIYSYRVRGITPFGEEGPPSDIVSGKAIVRAVDVPYITSAVSDDNISILIQWNFPATSDAVIRGFAIERSQSSNDFVRINSHVIQPGKRTYRDTAAGVVNYYRVVALTSGGQSYASPPYFAQLVDSLPPAVPRNVSATVDSCGVVTLAWTPNAEPDIYGYRLFRSWTAQDEPAQITSTPVRPPHYADTIPTNTLNRNIYYWIMAIDNSQNHSALSTPFALPIPDWIAPQPPIIIAGGPDSVGASITWLAAGSDDVIDYHIYRNDPSHQGWTRVATVPARADSIYRYTDNTCPSGKHAYYTIISRDETALESVPAHPIAVPCLPLTHRPAVKWEKYRLTGDEHNLRLAWRSDTSGLLSFAIYRSVNGGPHVLLQTVSAEENELTDTLIPGNHYEYRIIADFINGPKSAVSQPLTLSY